MKKSIKKILKEQLDKQNKIESLEDIVGAIEEGIQQLQNTYGFDDAADALDEYFEVGGVTPPLRHSQHHLRDVFNNIKKVRDDAEKAIDGLNYEIDDLSPPDNPVGNDNMDDYLRGGGAMGGL